MDWTLCLRLDLVLDDGILQQAWLSSCVVHFGSNFKELKLVKCMQKGKSWGEEVVPLFALWVGSDFGCIFHFDLIVTGLCFGCAHDFVCFDSRFVENRPSSWEKSVVLYSFFKSVTRVCSLISLCLVSAYLHSISEQYSLRSIILHHFCNKPLTGLSPTLTTLHTNKQPWQQ